MRCYSRRCQVNVCSWSNVELDAEDKKEEEEECYNNNLESRVALIPRPYFSRLCVTTVERLVISRASVCPVHTWEIIKFKNGLLSLISIYQWPGRRVANQNGFIQSGSTFKENKSFERVGSMTTRGDVRRRSCSSRLYSPLRLVQCVQLLFCVLFFSEGLSHLYVFSFYGVARFLSLCVCVCVHENARVPQLFRGRQNQLPTTCDSSSFDSSIPTHTGRRKVKTTPKAPYFTCASSGAWKTSRRPCVWPDCSYSLSHSLWLNSQKHIALRLSFPVIWWFLHRSVCYYIIRIHSICRFLQWWKVTVPVVVVVNASPVMMKRRRKKNKKLVGLDHDHEQDRVYRRESIFSSLALRIANDRQVNRTIAPTAIRWIIRQRKMTSWKWRIPFSINPKLTSWNVKLFYAVNVCHVAKTKRNVNDVRPFGFVESCHRCGSNPSLLLPPPRPFTGLRRWSINNSPLRFTSAAGQSGATTALHDPQTRKLFRHHPLRHLATFLNRHGV